MSSNVPVLSFTHGDATWTKLRERCRTDLYWFADVVLGYGSIVPMEKGVHLAFTKFMDRQTGYPRLDECQFRKAEMPRGVGKTTLETQAHTVQRILRDPNISVLIANEKAENAQDMLSAISHVFESNELVKALFPEIVPDDFRADTWKSTRINVKRTTGRKEPTVFIVGAGGTVTGMHPDVIIVDDLLSREAMENSRVGGGQLMQALNRWLHQLRPLLAYGETIMSEIVFVGTRWWFGDSYEHIEDWLGYGEEKEEYLIRVKLDDGTTQSVPAYRIGDLAVFRRAAIEDGRSIFPRKWDLEALAKMRMEDPVLFAANYMNHPTDDLTSIFKPSWVQTFQWVNQHTVQWTNGIGKREVRTLDQLDKMVYVDPGGFKTVLSGGDRARGAMVLVGATGDGAYLILDVFSEVETFLGLIRKMVEWAGRYKPRKIKIEQVAQQAGFLELVRRDMLVAKQNVSLEAVTPRNRDKDQRILQLEPFFQRGMVYIGHGGSFQEFRSQLEQFPRSARKDLLDALAYAAEDWAKASVKVERPEVRKARELAEYRAKRGIA